MMRTLEDDYGVEVHHAWGMTEMTPLGTRLQAEGEAHALPAEEQRAIREKQGHGMFGVDWKIVDGDGRELPWDGKAFGDL